MQSIYLIRSERNGLWDSYKIGIASDVGRRLAELQTGNPCLLSIESCWQFDNAQAVETVLHQKYGKDRIRGEWFKFTPSQVEEFDNLCNALGGLRQVPNEEIASDCDVEEAEEEQSGGTWYELVKVNSWYYLREMGWDKAEKKKVYIRNVGSLDECKLNPEYSEIAYRLEAIKFGSIDPKAEDK